MIHAGQLIERTLHEQGRTVTWFASQLCCTRDVYKRQEGWKADVIYFDAFAPEKQPEMWSQELFNRLYVLDVYKRQHFTGAVTARKP